MEEEHTLLPNWSSQGRLFSRSFSSGSQEAESGSQEAEHPDGRTTLSVLCFFQDQGVGFHSLPEQPECPRVDNCRGSDAEQSDSCSNSHKIPRMGVLTVSSKIKRFHAAEKLLKAGR